MPQDPETPAPRPELPMRLTRLRVKNFRSIADIDIPLSPLTVLVGPNGSGKSNVVDALRFVRDVFARGLDQAVMDREGMGVLQRWGTEGESISIGVDIDSEPRESDDPLRGAYYGLKPYSTISYEFIFTTNEDKTIHVNTENISLKIHKENIPKLSWRKSIFGVEVKVGDSEWSIIKDGGKDFKWLSQSYSNLWLPNELYGRGSTIFYGKKWYSPIDGRLHTRGEYEFIDATHFLNDFVFYNLNITDLRQPQRTLKETPLDEEGRNLAAVLRRVSLILNPNWKNLLFALRQAIEGFNTIEIEPVGGYYSTLLFLQPLASKHFTAKHGSLRCFWPT